jgi:hypothetical protein
MITHTNKHIKATPPPTDPAIIAVLFGRIVADLADGGCTDGENVGMLGADESETLSVRVANDGGKGAIRSEGLVVNIRDPNNGDYGKMKRTWWFG